MKTKIQKKATSVVIYIILTCLSFVILYPLFMKAMISVMSVEDLNDDSVRFFARHFNINNYIKAINYMGYFKNLAITGSYVLMVSITQVFAAVVIAYGFARFRFRGKKILFGFVLLTLIVPPQIISLPLYFQFRFFNLFGLLGEKGISLLGNPLSVLLLEGTGLGLYSGLLIFMLRQFFSGLPKELEESAFIDGAGPLRAFFSIALPSSVPMIVTAFLFSYVWGWTDNFYNSIFMPSNTFLQKQVLQLASSIRFDAAQKQGSIDIISVSLINNAGILLFIMPLLLLFLFGQRYFIESIERTGIVG